MFCIRLNKNVVVTQTAATPSASPALRLETHRKYTQEELYEPRMVRHALQRDEKMGTKSPRPMNKPVCYDDRSESSSESNSAWGGLDNCYPQQDPEKSHVEDVNGNSEQEVLESGICEDGFLPQREATVRCGELEDDYSEEGNGVVEPFEGKMKFFS